MHTLSSTELKNKLAANEKLTLVDVREPDEHAAFNIGGILLPLGQIMAMQLEDIEDLKDEPIVCYCRSGNRSMQASLMLETAGFTNVSNLTGGVTGWESTT